MLNTQEDADSCTFFLNGSRLSNFYPLGMDARTTITLGRMKPDLLVVRFAHSKSKEIMDWHRSTHNYNFELAPSSSSLQEIITNLKFFVSGFTLFIGMPLVLSLVHLLTFWFYRKQKEHLYYALFTTSIAGIAISALVEVIYSPIIFTDIMIGLLACFMFWSFIHFLYNLFDLSGTRIYRIFMGGAYTLPVFFITVLCAYELIPYNLFDIGDLGPGERWNFYAKTLMPISLTLNTLFLWLTWRSKPSGPSRLTIWTAGIVALFSFAVIPIDAYLIFGNSYPIMVLEVGALTAGQALYRALREKKLGATTVAIGILICIAFSIGAGIFQNFGLFLSGLFAMIVAFSLHLSRVIGRTGRTLEEKLIQVEDLSHTNLEQERALRQRMEDELEEAHQLQISMLPDNVPEHPSAEVNWSMKTATEVGGDYYDYRITDDDRLTLVLGDATGHGMQAGTLVTATKSLFQSLTTEGNLADTVSKMSVNLKSMNLHRLGMALTLLELDGHRLRYCAAGIPPMLVYRAKEDTVEEGETGGLPLGLTTRGNYHQTELTLESGDALLLMSDGLPERTNEAEEEFGYQRVQDLFHEVATDTPAEICRKMAAGGDAWAAGKEQDDDVSFLAVRLR
ncbi:MAG: SpoIIE family protein phosphatase [Bacteroidetes Order II. Incertae sedis bacterium]|nr:SpoIIE family protein phosphatase [Bacteroidetes Order II. bacterium]